MSDSTVSPAWPFWTAHYQAARSQIVCLPVLTPENLPDKELAYYPASVIRDVAAVGSPQTFSPSLCSCTVCRPVLPPLTPLCLLFSGPAEHGALCAALSSHL